jgi:hypothetical protein
METFGLMERELIWYGYECQVKSFIRAGILYMPLSNGIKKYTYTDNENIWIYCNKYVTIRVE